jgi:hypothetical protein
VKNAATGPEARLNATVFGDMLCHFIPTTNYYQLHVRYKDQERGLATKVDCLQGRMLARRHMVAGLVTKGTLRYLMLLVPKATAIRVLNMDPPRAGEITIARASDMQWPVRCDRAKGGRLSAVRSFGGFYHAA